MVTQCTELSVTSNAVNSWVRNSPKTDRLDSQVLWPQLNCSAPHLSHIHKMAPLNKQRVHRSCGSSNVVWSHFSMHKLNFTVRVWFNEEQKIKVKWILAYKFETYSHWNHLEAQTAADPPNRHSEEMLLYIMRRFGSAILEGRHSGVLLL